MRLDEFTGDNNSVEIDPKRQRLGEFLSEDKVDVEQHFAARTPFLFAPRGKSTEGKSLQDVLTEEKKYSESPESIAVKTRYADKWEAIAEGLAPLGPEDWKISAKEHPIAKAVGSVAGLIGTSYLTGGIAPLVTYSKQLSALPTVARFAAGRMAQTGTTFGIKELSDNIAEILSGDKKSFGEVISKTLGSTAWGAGFGAVSSIAAPLMRIPAEAAYGFTTSMLALLNPKKIRQDVYEDLVGQIPADADRGKALVEATKQADEYISSGKYKDAIIQQSSINAAIFAVFGLFNTKNLNITYKKAAFSGAKQALVDRMVVKGVNPAEAKSVADRYFQYAISRAGGWDKVNIGEFDKFSQGMRKGWKLYVEPKLNKAKPIVTKPTELAVPKAQPIGEGKVTKEQLAQAHIIAKEKLLVTTEGKPKPQYRKLAEGITGKKTMEDMTQEEAKSFIESLTKLSEPAMKGGKLVPPSIAKTKEIVPEGFFEQKFKKPTPAKLLTSQSRYAELLGVKKLVEPMEIGKTELDLEYGKLSNQTDIVVKKLKKLKTIPPEKMAQLLNTNETAPAELNLKEKEVFNYFDSLRKELLIRQNEALASQGLPPIKGVKAYFRHIADQMSEEVIEGKYAPPEGVKYWSEQMISKKIYNPMEMRRKIRDELLERFSKDLAYVTKSMVWTALKSIHLSIPKMVLNRELGVISKDKLVYKNLSPEERARYDAVSTMPAATKKWLLDYVNIVLTGRQTSLDESVNRWVTESPIKDAVNKVLIPFGKHLGQNPVTKLISNISRLPIYGVMGGINPRQLMRNKMQTLQNLALYGVRNTLKGYLPTSKFPVLEELKTDSLFKKSYSGFEDMPAELRGKFEKIGLAPFQWSAISNVSQAMNSAYHWTANKIQNPKNKELGWADPQRTYEEPVDFFYPSEKEKLLKEMEYGAHTTQFQYIGLGMPEVFRYKSLSGITRLQSWWMNHWFIFHREAATRAFTGQSGYDTNLKVTLGDRINYLKYLIIGGVILNTLGYERSFLLGTAPTGLPPTAALAYNLFVYYTNLGDDKYAKRKRGEAAAGIKSSAKTFIPGYLSIKDISALLSGEKDWTEYLFYKK